MKNPVDMRLPRRSNDEADLCQPLPLLLGHRAARQDHIPGRRVAGLLLITGFEGSPELESHIQRVPISQACDNATGCEAVPAGMRWEPVALRPAKSQTALAQQRTLYASERRKAFM